jgi:long-chain acyl-CoA synthetase
MPKRGALFQSLFSPADPDCGNPPSVNWQMVSHACSSISTTVATAYDTLGEDGLTHSLNEPNCVGLFTNAELLPTLSRILAQTPSVKFVIYDGEPKSSVLTDLSNVREGIQVLSLTELRDKGKSQPEAPLESRRPKPDYVACIMYTSGTTGPPKGVVITHANVVASIGGLYTSLAHHLTKTDCYLAYLPLAHILEYLAEAAFVFIGLTQGYARVKTLTDASVRNCKGDLVAFRPTIMVGVPAVWETIRKGIIAKVNAGGSVKKSVFNGAMSVKKAGVPVLSQLADSVVLSGVRAATGGRLRLALSGGAALSRETQEFLSVALVTMLQGVYISIGSDIRILELKAFARIWDDGVIGFGRHLTSRTHAIWFSRTSRGRCRNQIP